MRNYKTKNPKGVHITRSKKSGQYGVKSVSNNGNTLQSTKQINRKQSAFTNILSMAKLYNAILSGKAPVTDHHGQKWYLINGRFKLYTGK